MTMIGAQRSGGSGDVANLMIEIARDPGKLEEKIAAHIRARDEAKQANRTSVRCRVRRPRR